MNLLKDYYSLVKDFVEHNCILFVGAGVSQCAGLPSSPELSNGLAKELIETLRRSNQDNKIPGVTQNQSNLQEIAEYYHNFFGNHKAKERICEIIESRQKTAKTEIFDTIRNLPRNDIITTNYDSLLEDNLGSPEDHTVIWKKEQLSQYSSLKYNIFKIHGTIHDPTSIVVLRDDYSKLKQSSETAPVYKYLIGQLQVKTLVVVGYSLNDTDFRDLYFEANQSKNIFIVTKERDALTHQEWEKKGAKILEMDAEFFFHEMVDAIYEYKKEHPVSEIEYAPKEVVKIEDNNPFKYYTTDGLKAEQFFDLYKVFVPPEYAGFIKIYSIDKHHFVQGTRGTGKTVLLRGLSLEVSTRRKEKGNFIGFWLPLSTMFLGCVKREEEENDSKWFKFFGSYLTSLIIEKVCETLWLCHKENTLSFEDERVERFVEKVCDDLGIKVKKDGDPLKGLCDGTSSVRSTYHTAYDRSKFNITVDPAYLRKFMSHVEELHDSFRDKYFFIIIDDAHFMDENQKKVFISFITHREHPISFKIGTKADFGVSADFFGATILEGRDYETIYLDRLAGKEGAKEYRNFIERLANKRLAESNQPLNIKELLPKGKKLKRGELYSGFGNYVGLSSQIIRDFITLAKDTIYYAYPQIVREYVVLKPIPPNVQDEVIHIKSAIHLKEIDAAGELRKDLGIFIEMLGELFKKTIEISTQAGKPRTPSGIEIKNYHLLEERTENIIEKGIELQLFQIPLVYRLRQKTERPYHGLKFHRMLIPHYRLKLGYRHPRTVDAKLLNTIFTSPQKFVNQLIRTLPREEEPPGIQMEIDYHEEEREEESL